MTTIPAPSAAATPVVLPLSRAVWWLVGAAALALALYYFIGIDQGAVSAFGGSRVHDLVHDARHFLGFPCH